MNVLDLLIAEVIQARKASTSKGGEYHSACPGCGGNDRFHVWPMQNAGTGSYWCRGCEKTGDNVQFLRDFKMMSFEDACRQAEREDLLAADPAAARKYSRAAKPLSVPKPAELFPWQPNSYDLPPMTWMEQAEKMVEHCHQALLDKKSELAYLEKRGIPRAAVIKHRLGWHEGPKGTGHRYSSYAKWGLDVPVNEKTGKTKPLWIPRGIVIPCIIAGTVVRIRIRRPKEDVTHFGNKYHIFPGSSMRTMVLNRSAKAFVIVEAELDAIAVDHAAGDLVGSVPVMTVEGKPDDIAAPILMKSLCILNSLDIGDTGGGAKAAARAREWWRRFDQCELWPAPAGKDPGEAAEKGEDLRLWVLAGLPPVFHLGVGADHSGQSFSSGLSGEGADISVLANGEEVVDGDQGVLEIPAAETAAGINGIENDVAELGLLLQAHPVKLVKDGQGGVAIKWDRAWRAANMETAGRISDLVFLSPDCGRHIDLHPAMHLHGTNFCAGGCVGNG